MRRFAFVAVLIAFAACLEHSYLASCPADAPYPVGDRCYATQPDGFMPPDGFVAPDGYVPMDFTMPGACMVSKDCAAATPICNANDTCRACSGSTDDSQCMARDATLPRCADSTSTKAGQCVQCRSTTELLDCPAATPICGNDGSCRKCRAHSECISGVCALDGHCVLAADIAYVDNMGQVPATCKLTGQHDGTSWSTAFCDIEDAVNGAKAYALVKGESSAYGPVTINNRNITIVGPGFAATPTAQIQGLTSQGVAVTGNSNVVVDGFDINSSTTGKDGVICTTAGTASITLVRSYVHGNAGNGLNTSGCAAVVDANQIGENQKHGLALGSGTTYTVSNNLIYRNTSTGVLITSDASGTFQFNTVADNGGGIDCGAATAKTIERSIVAGNLLTGTPQTQFAGSCALIEVAVDHNEMSALGGQKMADPEFIGTTTSPYNYRLKNPSASNLACCFDKVNATVDGGAMTLPDHDVDFTARPKSNGWDYGGHEAY